MNIGRKYLSIKQAAGVIGVTTLTLRNWDKGGKLRPYRNPINNYRYYRVDQIEAFLRQMEGSREHGQRLKLSDIS